MALAGFSRERLDTLRNMPVPTLNGGAVPLSVVAEIGFGAGPAQINRTNQVRQLTIGADLAPGLVSGQAMAKIENLPTLKQLPLGVTRLVLGSSKWQQEMLKNFTIAVISGILLVLAVLILLYRKVIPPFVNMGFTSLGAARWRACAALNRQPAFAARFYWRFIVARYRREKFDLTRRFCAGRNHKRCTAQGCDYKRWSQAVRNRS